MVLREYSSSSSAWKKYISKWIQKTFHIRICAFINNRVHHKDSCAPQIPCFEIDIPEPLLPDMIKP